MIRASDAGAIMDGTRHGRRASTSVIEVGTVHGGTRWTLEPGSETSRRREQLIAPANQFDSTGALSDNCAFCPQLSSRPSRGRPEDTILASTGSFVVWPSVGSLVEGWLIVVPKKHCLALASLGDADHGELTKLVSTLDSTLSAAYGLPVHTFEHGPAVPGTSIGCSVDHAHLHVVPLGFDLATAARAFDPHRTWFEAGDLSTLRGRHLAGTPYLWVRSPTGGTWTTFGGGIPSQFFRRLIARELDLGEPEWRREPRREIAARTVRTLLSA
jgi:diadenosine tetraphosphate (Ap4A) HIT family hydrolase